MVDILYLTMDASVTMLTDCERPVMTRSKRNDSGRKITYSYAVLPGSLQMYCESIHPHQQIKDINPWFSAAVVERTVAIFTYIFQHI